MLNAIKPNGLNNGLSHFFFLWFFCHFIYSLYLKVWRLHHPGGGISNSLGEWVYCPILIWVKWPWPGSQSDYFKKYPIIATKGGRIPTLISYRFCTEIGTVVSLVRFISTVPSWQIDPPSMDFQFYFFITSNFYFATVFHFYGFFWTYDHCDVFSLPIIAYCGTGSYISKQIVLTLLLILKCSFDFNKAWRRA